MLATNSYKKQLYMQHEIHTSWGHGASINKFKHCLHFLEKEECKTIIDYGCGKSNLKDFVEKNYNYEVTEYDIGIEGKDVLNNKADFIVCVDVLEHIEPECLEDVLKHIHRNAIKGVYFSICLVASYGCFEDGSNLHTIIKNGDWWYSKVLQYFKFERETLSTKSHIEFLATPIKLE